MGRNGGLGLLVAIVTLDMCPRTSIFGRMAARNDDDDHDDDDDDGGHNYNNDEKERLAKLKANESKYSMPLARCAFDSVFRNGLGLRFLWLVLI